MPSVLLPPKARKRLNGNSNGPSCWARNKASLFPEARGAAGEPHLCPLPGEGLSGKGRGDPRAQPSGIGGRAGPEWKRWGKKGTYFNPQELVGYITIICLSSYGVLYFSSVTRIAKHLKALLCSMYHGIACLHFCVDEII